MSPGERQSLATVARALKVSTASVSNAFNRPDRVSDELRSRVLEHARSVGYAGPDPAARQLRRGRTDVVGLVFTDDLAFAFEDQASVVFLAGVAEACGASGRNLLMLAAGTPSAGSTRGTSGGPITAAAAVDGLIVYSVPDADPHLAAAVERGLPVVVVDQPRDHPHADWVGLDDRAAARDLARHVVELGHRRIGVICTRLGTTRYNGPASQERRLSATYAVQRERLAGLFEGFAEVGIGEGDVEVEERFLASRASGGEGLDAILSRRPDVTAICCLADVLALGVLDAAGRRGLRVAKDLTVTGFDDIPESADAGLTTVHQPLGLKGREAGRLLLERLAEAAPGRAVSGRHPRRVLLPAIIQVRRSSGPVTERSTS
ncbi:HTH-type transcriptional repressor PurR [mine drainage metagenome]|uniref:HTH-type transcriptional repressor PurR n=1 Tax=mine drainage metagenome TaxID=410659 RepID=A0A1J5R513_9ZZZZ